MIYIILLDKQEFFSYGKFESPYTGIKYINLITY